MRTRASDTTHEPVPSLETQRSQSCWDSTILRVPALLPSVRDIGLRRYESRPPHGFDRSQKLCDRERLCLKSNMQPCLNTSAYRADLPPSTRYEAPVMNEALPDA